MIENNFFEDLVENLEKQAEGLTDEGHQHLMSDLAELLRTASSGAYHDFHRNCRATPKTDLIFALRELITHAKEGRYDNDPDGK